ncbi:hypothetical protein POM88_043906 [Heracleum sosnowskyi]|uniref:PORR domain-containing protein n=1 Tax=Heracleum sosnowskyi TaxID=360622 RepID=A0AAD8M4Q6_9APIA|nr:hypothetical protein POM88_043906 [Heracleum sosnowskyi]
MLVCLYKSQLQTLILNLNLRPFVRNYRTKRIITTDSSEFRNSFLKKQCGLSGKSLIRASKHVNFDSSNQRPHSVVNIFRIFGFPPSNITKIITRYPRILQCYPHKAIQPKLDFLLSILASQSDVVDTVTRNPFILERSLDNHLIPFVNQLKCLTGCYPSTAAFLKCNPVVLTKNNSESSMLNIKFLVTLGVPSSQILKVLKMYGHASTTPHDRFRDVVLKIMDMGFDLSSSYFLHALRTLTFMEDSTWESKCVLLKSFGFSDQEILFMFKRLPQVMCFSEKAIIMKLEFFLNKLQWTTFRLSSNPGVLAYSLEKRTIPRCYVLQALVLKSSSNESYSLSTILSWSDRRFIEYFVTAYKDEVPEIMEAYKGSNGLACLKLLKWDDEFAVSALQRGKENVDLSVSGNGETELRKFKRGQNGLSFTMSFLRGYGAQKKVKAWMDEFQKL